MRRRLPVALLIVLSINGQSLGESYPDNTFKRWVEISENAVVARRVKSTNRKPKVGERVTCVVTAVIKSDSSLKVGDSVAFTRRKRQVWEPRMPTGSSLLLLGDRERIGEKSSRLNWHPHADASAGLAKYVRNAPGTRVDLAKRLAYFSRFLDHAESPIASDALHEFEQAYCYERKACTKFVKGMKPQRVRGAFKRKDLKYRRVRLLGILIGLCGTKDDAERLHDLIVNYPFRFRRERDGLMIGYLLLTGERGLDVLERTKLATRWVVDRNGKPILDKAGKRIAMPWWERYHVFHAVADIGERFPKRIARKRLLRSLRVQLDDPELNDVVINCLARWKDWSVRDRLMKSYGRKNFTRPATKRAIVRYFLLCERDLPQKKPAKPPAHVLSARKYLRTLRRIDPRTVNLAERWFIE